MLQKAYLALASPSGAAIFEIGVAFVVGCTATALLATGQFSAHGAVLLIAAAAQLLLANTRLLLRASDAVQVLPGDAATNLVHVIPAQQVDTVSPLPQKESLLPASEKADIAVQCSDDVADLTARLARADTERKDLLRQNDSLRAEVSELEASQKRLREAARLRSACLVRLAKHLSRSTPTEADDESLPVSKDNLPTTAAPESDEPQAEPPVVENARSDPDNKSEEGGVEGAAGCEPEPQEQAEGENPLLRLDPPSTAASDGSGILGATSPEPEEASSSPQSTILQRLRQLLDDNCRLREQLSQQGVDLTDRACQTSSPNEDGQPNADACIDACPDTAPASATVDTCSGAASCTSPKEASKRELINKLARMAADNPGVRDSLKERLKGPPTEGPAEPSATPATQPPSPAQAEIVRRLRALADSNAKLQEELRESEATLLSAHKEASSLRTDLSERVREVAALQLERDVLREELRTKPRGRGLGPALDLRWADEASWSWPGGAASTRGVERLRHSVEGRSAQLSIGPPPADWPTWLQLGLRRGQPKDPCLLQLQVADHDDSAYVGMLWAKVAG